MRKRRHTLQRVLARRLSAWLEQMSTLDVHDPYTKNFAQFGTGSALFAPQGTTYNENEIAIGENTLIGPFVSLSVGMAPGQKMVTHPVIKIGNGCVIGRGSHIVAHFAIEIEDEVQTGPYVYITDQNHSYRDPDQPIGRQMPNEAPVHIGQGSWLGAHVVVLPGATIGRHCTIGAGAVVTGDIPDFSVAVGVPARVIRKKARDNSWPRVGNE